jgi:hypothetical protein
MMLDYRIFSKKFIISIFAAIFIASCNTGSNPNNTSIQENTAQSSAATTVSSAKIAENNVGMSDYIPSASNTNGSEIVLSNKGMIFTGSQAITTLDNESNFAVGKWDNTIQIINSSPKSQYEYSPNLTQTLVLNNNNGVQMLAYLDNSTFTSSNDETSLALWQRGSDHKYKFLENISYKNFAANAGAANSGALINFDGTHYFVSGHENGYIIIWEFNGSTLKFVKEVNVQSPNPIPSPYKLKNIRGVSSWKDGMFVTGSEDGDLVLLTITGKEVNRIRYSQNAQRGINQTQILSDYLLVSNCEVGPNDKNLWLYHLADFKINYLDSLNLKKDQALSQVFDFGIAMGQQNGRTLFFASTEEGILWNGFISNNKLDLIGNMKVSSNLGSVLYYNGINETLAQSAYDTQIFKVSSSIGEKVPEQTNFVGKITNMDLIYTCYANIDLRLTSGPAYMVTLNGISQPQCQNNNSCSISYSKSWQTG